MTSTRTRIAIVGLGACCAATAWGRPVRVVVRVPADTAGDVFLAGSLPAVGGWRADGVRLTRQPDGTYAATVDLPAGTPLAFKFTRGTWATVERTADGGDRDNRTADGDQIDATVARWATGPAAGPAHTVVGTLRLHDVGSKALGGHRTVRVWLPPGYDRAKRYDVLYLFDGQNLFDRATGFGGHEWEVDETLTRLIGSGAVPPLIVVGLDNGPDRTAEYTFDADPAHGGGRGAATAAFLFDDVLPLVDRTYATTGRRMLGGSSLGGLLAVDVARRHRGAFAGLMVMSPSLWWDGGATLAAVAADPSPLAGARVWADVGTAEEPGDDGRLDVLRVRRLAAALSAGGVANRLVVDAGAGHNEAAWAGRFPAAVTYLMTGR